MVTLWLIIFLAGVGLIVWGAEAFAEHLGRASVRMGVSAFALAFLLAGAEPEELVTSIVASVRGSPGIALGDVVGANAAICLVALGVGALVAPLPFRAAVMRYALLGLPLGFVASWFAWDGRVGRLEAGILVALYAVYVAAIWLAERKPPELGEVAELAEARDSAASGQNFRLGRDLGFVVAGAAAMAFGATLLVEAVERISSSEAVQTRLGLTLVGFATGFELVVLAWSAARRGISEAVVAGVVGSFAYNCTMTLGAGALARPLRLQDTGVMHLPLALMLASLTLVILLASRRQQLAQTEGVILIALYPAFVAMMLVGRT